MHNPSNSLFIFNWKEWCPGGESNPHEEKSPEDFKSSASAIPPPGPWQYKVNRIERLSARRRSELLKVQSRLCRHWSKLRSLCKSPHRALWITAAASATNRLIALGPHGSDTGMTKANARNQRFG